MADFGFVGDAYAAPAPQQDCQELINWYPEVDPSKAPGSRAAVALYPTPGTRVYLNIQTALQSVGANGPVRAIFSLAGASVFNATLVAAQTPIALFVVGNAAVLVLSAIGGTLPTTAIILTNRLNTSSGPCTITSNGIAAMITDGVDRYGYDYSNATPQLLRLVDGPWTGGVRCDIVDNFIIYNKPNSKQWAATNALSTATAALSFASTFASYDNLQCVFADQGQVAAIGTQTTEFWGDAGSFPFPYARIPGTIRQFGTAAPYSVTRFGKGFALLGQSQLGQGIVYHVQNYEFSRISTHSVEQDLVGQVLTDAFGFSYSLEGHEFYVLNFPTANRTWVYDLASQAWHKRESQIPANYFGKNPGTIGRWLINCTAVINGQVVGGGYDGNLYALDNSYGAEDVGYFNAATQTQQVRRVRTAPHLTRDGDFNVYDELQIMFQQGVGKNAATQVYPAQSPVSGAPSDNPQAMLEWSNDGGMTWGNVHTRGLGKIGEYRARARWLRTGRARDRVFRLTCTDPVYNVVLSANLRFTPCGN